MSLALALALGAKSLALALDLRVVALTPSLFHAAVNVPDTAPCCLVTHMFTAHAPSGFYIFYIFIFLCLVLHRTERCEEEEGSGSHRCQSTEGLDMDNDEE